MNIETILKQFEKELENKKSKDYHLGIVYSLGMFDKYFKNKNDCVFYNLSCCPKCYLCENYQTKEEFIQ